MLRLNEVLKRIQEEKRQHSNTTNVKVKLSRFFICPIWQINSNTTNVKVKLWEYVQVVKNVANSNTTNVKVKL